MVRQSMVVLLVLVLSSQAFPVRAADEQFTLSQLSADFARYSGAKLVNLSIDSVKRSFKRIVAGLQRRLAASNEPGR